jgi:hypothetical protein
MAVPYIVPESTVSIFKFYDGDAVHEAVFANGRVVRLAGIFSAHQKQEAFAFAQDLCQAHFTVMTPGSILYRVWVDVRCPRDFKLGMMLTGLAPVAPAAVAP